MKFKKNYKIISEVIFSKKGWFSFKRKSLLHFLKGIKKNKYMDKQGETYYILLYNN